MWLEFNKYNYRRSHPSSSTKQNKFITTWSSNHSASINFPFTIIPMNPEACFFFIKCITSRTWYDQFPFCRHRSFNFKTMRGRWRLGWYIKTVNNIIFSITFVCHLNVSCRNICRSVTGAPICANEFIFVRGI